MWMIFLAFPLTRIGDVILLTKIFFCPLCDTVVSRDGKIHEKLMMLFHRIQYLDDPLTVCKNQNHPEYYVKRYKDFVIIIIFRGMC